MEISDIIIDPEFAHKIPPLTDDEFRQLEENIVADGEVYEPIITWNGAIVDGHNRWKIIQKHPEIPYKIREAQFADKWEAFEWMYRKQLGRRNLTNEQKTYMIGKMYEARKKSVGAQEGHTGRNQHTSANMDKMSELATRREIKDGTSGEIGKEFGMDGRSVRRAEKFAQGVDKIRDIDPETADKILAGNSTATKTEVQKLSKAEPKEVKSAVEAIKNPNRVTFPSGNVSKPKKLSPAAQEIAENDKRTTDKNAVVEYGIDDLLEDLRMLQNDFIDKYHHAIDLHMDVATDNGRKVHALMKEFETEWKEVKERIR